jgi:glycosyltransferase involved in cell wall biosynthesis
MMEQSYPNHIKKIVIVSYATYPGNSPRNMRTNELAKELAKQGHDVTLYVLTGTYDYESYEKDTGVKIKSLGKTYFFKYDPKTGNKLNIFTRVASKLVGNIFEFPYIELVRNAYCAIKEQSNIDLLITIAVPYPLHWGAALLRTLNEDNLKHTVWVADCGDPYMGNDFNKKFFYFEYIEKWFCRKADFISIPIESAKKGYYPEFLNKVKVIPQGFNFNETIKAKEYKKNVVPTFIYAGIFYEKLRDPRPFLDYLVTLKKDFKFIVYTKTPTFLGDYKEKLGNKLQIYSYIPRDELILEMSKVDFLVNFENPSTKHSPSKLIDYALSGRPILSLNTNVELNTSLISQFLSDNYEQALKLDNIEQYNIKNVAKEFLCLLNKSKEC